MPNMSSIDYTSLYCLFKGEPGTRKSTSALSFPKPQYWISWDQKMDALGLPMREWGIDPTLIDFDDYSDWDRVKMKLESFQMTCKYRTIVIDSITSGADAINRQTRRIKAGEGSGKKVGGISVDGFEEFNAESSALHELVALTKELKKARGINVILIAHIIQKEQKSPDGQTHMSRIIVTAGKSIAQKIPAYCSEVYHFNIKTGPIVGAGGQYALKTTHTGDDFARTSLPLNADIEFGNEPLYDKYVLPAIQKMKPPTVISQQPPQPQGQENANSAILKS